jgi:hypothetical protein
MNRFTTWRRCLVLAAVLLLTGAGSAFGQAQLGSVFGTVTDNQGAALPGVRIELTGIGAPRTQFTDAQGNFRFPNLDPGSYALTASLEGFSTVEYPSVSVRVGRSTTLEIQLSAAVEETITVTSESPLLDERKISQGTTVSQIELEKIPTARDPWAIVTQTPGVISDRINVGGNESGQQAVFRGPANSDDENTFAVDGVVITDMAAIGASPTYYDFDQFEEFQITTGGTDISTISAGVTLNLVTKRGSNNPRGSARYLLTDSDKLFGIFEEADPDIASELCTPDKNGCHPTNPQTTLTAGNRINEVLDFGFEAGGPILRDRLWIWGSYGRNDIKQFVASGQADNTLLENTAIKLNGQIVSANSAVFSWNRGDKIKTGRNAGPSRPDPTTWNQEGPTEIWKLEDTHVFSSDFYLTGIFSYVDGGFQLIPKGGFCLEPGCGGPETVWDPSGVWQNTFLGGIDDRNTDGYQLDGSYFFNTGNLNHELKFGASYRFFEQISNFGWPGGRDILNIAGTNFGVADGPVDFFQADRAGIPVVETEYTAAWLQDTLTMGNLTINGGLRYDLQEGSNPATTVAAHPIFPALLPALNFQGNEAGFEWETILPRLGVTYALGAERRTLLRASYSRFAEQLETSDVARLNPTSAAYAYYVFIDADGDNVFDVGEAADLVDFAGFDPSNPTSLVNPNRNDPNLDPEITDEVLLGVEHALLPELVAGFTVTLRNVSDILETRQIANCGPTENCPGGGGLSPGTRLITSDDYLFSGNVVPLAGRELPNGDTYSVPVFTLAPGVQRSGGSLLTNGDRELDYLGYTLSLTKRLSNRWMARAYVNYGEAEWDIPASFFRFDDPTDLSGSGDNDGDLFAVQSAGSGNKGDVWLQSTWTANLNGMYQVAPDRPWGFNVAGNVFGREGYPLPYFHSVTPADGQSRAVQVVTEIDQFRTDDIVTFDVRLEKDMAFTDNLSGILSIDAFNLTNENYVLQRERSLSAGRPNFLDETLSPRIYRLGFRLNWR